MLVAALIGFAFGFIGSMPVAGPIAVLVFTRGVEDRFRSGIAIAAGAALAEGIYAFLAFWGFSTLLADYEILVPISRGAAAAILAVLGLVFLRRRSGPVGPPRAERHGTSLALGFTITALNPTLIATWTAAVTTLFSTGLVSFAPHLAWPFSLSAIVGILAWFGALLLLLRRARGRLRQATLDRIVRVMGALLLALSVWFAVQLVRWLAGAR